MRRLLIDSIPGARRLALMEDGVLADFMLERLSAPATRGGIYLARVADVIPSINAAFLDMGGFSALMNVHQQPPAQGQSLIVQVSADAHPGKDAKATGQIHLDGRFASLEPAGKGISVSQKIGKRALRDRLMAVVPRGLPGKVTVRSRAAAVAATGKLDMVAAEITHMAGLWGEVLEQAEESTEPRCLLPAPTAIDRAALDWLTDETGIICADSPTLGPLRQALSHLAPDVDLKPHFAGESGLFSEEGIEDELAALTAPHLPLTGGGVMSFYETPALLAIDVDSGSAGSWAPGQTADAVNEEAAKALPRQLRLRQLGGTIVVDFMGFADHIPTALTHLREALSTDPISSKPTGVSGVGLAVFSRRRLGPSLAEQMQALAEDTAKTSGKERS